MNTKRLIVLGFALVAASAAALLARGMMGGGTPKVEAKIAPADGDERSAGRQLQSSARPGAHRRHGALAEAGRPPSVDSSFITHAAVASIDEAVKGTVVRAPLFAGQPITNTAIVHGDAAGFMAAMLKPGMRAVSITISADSGAGGFILPNDRVDLILTRKFDDNPPRVRVKTILSDVRVLAVDQTFKQDKDTKTVVGKTATLELTPAQAELVAAAAEAGHALAVAARRSATATRRWPAMPSRSAATTDPVSVIRYGVRSSATALRMTHPSATGRKPSDSQDRRFSWRICLLLALAGRRGAAAARIRRLPTKPTRASSRLPPATVSRCNQRITLGAGQGGGRRTRHRRP